MSKMPAVGDGVEWTVTHAGKAYHHTGVVRGYFERGGKVVATVLEDGRMRNVPAARLKPSSRRKNYVIPIR